MNDNLSIFALMSNRFKKIFTKFDEQDADLTEIITSIDDVGTSVETVQVTADDIRSALTSELAALKEELLASISSSSSSSGVVKSVQRGVTTSTTITLSTAVDPNKCLVILNSQ